MDIYRDGVEIDILPETAKCCADDAERNPLNINMCPIGEQYCSGDCDYYTENKNAENVTENGTRNMELNTRNIRKE